MKCLELMIAFIIINKESIQISKLKATYMSRYIHYAIVVTDFAENLEIAYQGVREIIEKQNPDYLRLLTPIFQGIANSYCTFILIPSGLSYSPDEKIREEIINYLHTSDVEFIYTEFGLELERLPAIIDSSTHYLYNEE